MKRSAKDDKSVPPPRKNKKRRRSKIPRPPVSLFDSPVDGLEYEADVDMLGEQDASFFFYAGYRQ